MLKDVLLEWKKEVEKKPPEMSVDQAYDTLGLKTGVGGYVPNCVKYMHAYNYALYSYTTFSIYGFPVELQLYMHRSISVEVSL